MVTTIEHKLKNFLCLMHFLVQFLWTKGSRLTEE